MRLEPLVVVPSPDPDNQCFWDGLTEEPIDHLAQIPGLRVVVRTSGFQFEDAARDIQPCVCGGLQAAG